MSPEEVMIAMMTSDRSFFPSNTSPSGLIRFQGFTEAWRLRRLTRAYVLTSMTAAHVPSTWWKKAQHRFSSLNERPLSS